MNSGTRVHVGGIAPFYTGITNAGTLYSLEKQAGRPVAMILLGPIDGPSTTAFVQSFERHMEDFRALGADVIALTTDEPDDAFEYTQSHPTCLIISCEAAPFISTCDAALPAVLVLDANRVVLGRFSGDQPERAVVSALICLAGLPREPAHDVVLQAPVLLLHQVIPRALCFELIELFEKGGHFDSGFMSIDDAGQPVLKIDHNFKQRQDHFIHEDHPMHSRLMDVIAARIAPEIKKAFHVDVTHCERFLVACYAESGGYFRRHRDDTGAANAHRQFAITLNLNTEAYEGGHLTFPEYGPHRYRPGTGDAAIFSGSMLHEALPVTRGKRYALLGFLYNIETQARRDT